MSFIEYQHLEIKRSYLLDEGELNKLRKTLINSYCNLSQGISEFGLDKPKGLEKLVK